VTAHLEWRDDAPQMVELTVKAKADGRGLRTADLEVLRPERIARYILRNASFEMNVEPGGAVRVSPVDWSDPANERDWWRVDGLLREATAAAANRPATRTELRAVADVYEGAKAHGVNALTAVAMRLGVSERTAARRVKLARDAGLLPAVTKGATRG